MYKREMAIKNKILEIKVGSHLYGLNTENSDEDFSGIFIPDIEYVYGFKTCDEVDLSIVNKLENGKNSKNAIDRKFYNIRKFFKLAIECNPNIIEQLFATPENIVFINDIGKEILSNRKMFLHKGLYQKFIGYAMSQKRMIQVKKDNFDNLELAQEFLEQHEPTTLLTMLEKHEQFKKLFKSEKESNLTYYVGDMQVNKNQTVKKAIWELEKRIGEKTNRKELIRKFGYDTKFSYHLIRLLLEGKELLQTGNLEFPIYNKKLLLDIKNGLWSLEQVLTYADQIEYDLKNALIESKLPSNPNYKFVEDLLIKIMKEYYLK